MKVLGFIVAACTADGVSGLLQNADKNRPVTKVIKLLKDMQANLQKEAEEDEAVYNKLACWCETNDKAKTQAIADAEAKITDLVSKIEGYTALSSRLSTEIKNLEVEVAKNQQALDKATSIRKKELADFNAEEKDMLQSISALKSAVTVLSKHHRPPTEALINISNMIKYHLHKNNDLVMPSQRKVLKAFLQAPADYFDAAPTFKQSYAPQSGEIFGILNNMLETFQANLSQSQKDEMAAQAAFEELKEAKTSEIKEGQAHAAKKKQERADTDEKNADAKEDLEDTRNSLSADQKFLMELKEKCQMTDQEWEQRQKTRAEETQAVSEALSVLSGDDAHDTFTRTFNFVQLRTNSAEKSRREEAAKVLLEASARLNKPQLSTLATQVRLDAFVRVKKAIDDMVAKLLKEKEDEIKHKDFCNDELNQNDKNTALKTRTKQELEAAIDTLKSEIETLRQEIETLTEEIAELNKQLKRAGEDREAENKDFQTTVADQRSTQQLLQQALTTLKGFYAKKNKNVALNQEPAGPPPPAGFKTYKKQEGAGGVMGLIQQIINDAKVMEAEAVQAETDAQKAYETYVKNTNDSITNKQSTIVDKQAVKAKKEKTQASKERDLENTMTELEELANSAAALHKACDFVLKNFDIRQTARDQEVEALRQAKSILSGAKFNEFLQRRA